MLSKKPSKLDAKIKKKRRKTGSQGDTKQLRKKTPKNSVPQGPQSIPKSLQNGIQKQTFFNLGTQRGAKGAQDPKNIQTCASKFVKNHRFSKDFQWIFVSFLLLVAAMCH